MAVRGLAAPPTPWSKSLSKPQIDSSAYVYSDINVIGDVRIGPNVMIAPGTSIRADEGTPFAIGAKTNIQDGVVIHGLEQGRVTGDDGKDYSVWIGGSTSITHMALIHGPAYVGDNCFIGFRSTVFNARVNSGCIVMMHALIQDVEIPPGKFVPSGAVITSQQQANRLPDVQPSDVEFAHHVIGINQSLRSGYRCADDIECITPIQEPAGNGSRSKGGSAAVAIGSSYLSPDAVEQVRQLLIQGYQIGTEHADKRRFRASAWNSCKPITTKREPEVLAALEACMSEHAGEYVRLVGVDTKAKRRVAELVIQRPEGQAPTTSARSATLVPSASSSASRSVSTPTGNDLSGQVRQLLNQGCQISTEHADKRRFRASAWTSGKAITSNRESDIVAALNAAMAEHAGQYVRLVGIDPKAKRRVAEVIIQRPDGKTATASSVSSNTASTATASAFAGVSRLANDIVGQVRQLLAQGYQIGMEHADQRRFRASAWTSCKPINSNRDSEVIAGLEACMAEHAGEYVRLIGIDPKAKRRVAEVMIQRPNGNTSSSSNTSTAVNTRPANSSASAKNAAPNGNARLDANTVSQVRQLLTQGLQIGMEHADKRRFRASAWASCKPIASNREADVLAGLEACIAEHAGEYVRLIGIDPKAKRRVAELVIQRP